MRRKHLQKTVMQLIADRGNRISRAGVFTAAQDGVLGLRAYIEANQKDNAFLTRVTLEECLLFAAVVNDSKTALGLLEVGVDPYVGLLSNNLEKYHKGILPWNPSIVAAAAGHLEVLTLLLSQINLSSFLDIAPIHELIHHKKLQEGYMGGELCRLNNMRQDYLWRSNPAVEGSLDRIEDCLIGRERKWETLEYIRTIAHSSGSGQKIDLDIIEAAVFKNRKPGYWRRTRRLHLPCEVLLIKGLIDTHLDYEEDGMDMLQISIRNHCSFAVVRFLSDKGFKVHSRPGGRDHNTMLHDALLSQSPDRSDIVDFLLREGADCQFCGEGLTILEASLWNLPSFGVSHSSEYQRTFERLLDAGAPVYHFPQKRLSKWRSPIPLLFCLQPSDARDDLILRVVDAGPPLNDCGYGKGINGKNMTSLQAAIISGNETIARELIRRGADVHAPAYTQDGMTALQAACLCGIPIHFLEYLVIVLGVDVNEPPAKIGGLTSLAGAVLQRSLNTVEFLLDHGADVNAACSFLAPFKDNKHDLVRPLDFAAAFRSSDMVEFLLKAGGRSGKAGLGGSMGIAERLGHFAVLSVLQSWDKKHGRRILEDEALWQSRNPEQALLMYEAEK
jgi:ankyrin repeat protein